MKSAFLSFTLLLGLFTNKISAQTPTWEWFRGATGKGQQEGWDVAVDKNKNVYVIGWSDTFSVKFDTLTIHYTGNPNPYGIMSYIVKYSPTGNMIWVKTMMNATMTGIVIDKNDNIYVEGSVDSISQQNVYVAKFDTTGNKIWQSNTHCTGNSTTNAIATDNTGDIYIGGYYICDSIAIGPYMMMNPYYASHISSFIVKYSPSGNVLWAKPISASSSGWVQENAIAIDNSNNIYLGGTLGGSSISFGSILLSAPNTGGTPFFIAKYDASGSAIWAKTSNGDFFDGIDDITADGNGNVYVTGFFTSDSLSFGSCTLYSGVPSSVCTNCTNFFVAKYDPSGNAIWARSAPSSMYRGASAGYCITSDYYGDIYITGSYNYSIQFDSILIQDTLANEPMFIISYDSSGNIICAGGLPGGGDDQCGICLDPYGNVYIAGDYMGDTFATSIDTLFATGAESVFVGKFTCGIKLTDIRNTNAHSGIKIYPNPSSSTFHFSGLASGNSIEIYDLLGRSIYSATTDRDTYPVSLSGHPTGVYFYRVTEHGITIQQGKIVLE